MPIFAIGERRVELRGEHHYIAPDAAIMGSVVLEADVNIWFPGDIIQTGSPAGVALFMQPQRFLRDGDRVRCEAEGLGAIENLVREQ
jgi:hypothetical protein